MHDTCYVCVFHLAWRRPLAVVCPLLPSASADDAGSTKKSKSKAQVVKAQIVDEKDIPTYNLLDAMNQGLVGVEATGRGDGRMTVSVTNNSGKQLRVVLPPGIIAQAPPDSLAVWVAWAAVWVAWAAVWVAWAAAAWAAA